MTNALADVLAVAVRPGRLDDVEYIADTWGRTLQVLDRTPGSAARCKAAARALLTALDATGARVLVACSPDADELIRGYLIRDAAGVLVFAYVRRKFRGARIYARLRGTP